MVQAHLAKLPGLGQVGQCQGVEDAQALIIRVLEVPNPGIGDQRFEAVQGVDADARADCRELSG